LTTKPEPPVPDAAFETETVTREQADALIGTERFTESALTAQRLFETEMYLWGREGWMQVDRLCRAAKAKLPDLPVECEG
jgi:hypothetical protein